MLSIAALFLSLTIPAADAPVDYVRQVKPLIAGRCYTCHGALKQQAGLRLDTAAAIRRGGDSGPAVVPGKSGESLLMARCTARDVDVRMPPESEGTPLKPGEIALLSTWIDQGAQGPEHEQPEADPREHWAFRSPVRAALPQVRNIAWVQNPIDAFIAAEHERLGLKPQPAADARTLLRRVYLDLIGLPPTRDEQEAFLADDSPQAYERVVDRLLASPHYGERWGRHWMDIWRYSDWWGLGAEVRNSQKHIWHWRDWIIESLNADVGYDEMLRQMLAADELYPTDLDKLRATGYLARHYFKFNRNTWMEGLLEHTSKAFLGLTINCARCHDHKYDPLSQTDYYRLRAFFEPYQVRTDQSPGEVDFEKDGIPRVFDCNLDVPTYRFMRGDEKQPVKDQPLTPGLPALLLFDELKIEPVSLPLEGHQPGLRPGVVQNHLAAAEQQIAAARDALEKGPGENRWHPLAEKMLAAAEAQLSSVRARAAADRARHAQPPSADTKDLARHAARLERIAAAAKAEEGLVRAELELIGIDEAKKADSEKKLAAANDAFDKALKAMIYPGDAYTPLAGALKSLESNLESEESRRKPFPTTSTGRRSALVRWLTDRRHPLTARVAVNHLWARHTGQPLAPTVFDFGRKGAAPTHSALLDWLAVELMEHGWSMKHIHQLIVTSNTYRLSSSAADASDNVARDEDNRWYWRANPTRLEAQIIRDSLLHLASELDLKLGGPSIDPASDAPRRRSLYFVHSHNDHHRFLSMFDDADVQECYRREQSIVPQQSLALSNSRQALDAAATIAGRLEAVEANASEEAFIRAAFATVLANEPTADELLVCQQALAAWTTLAAAAKPADAARRARLNLVHALLNHNDFVTVR